MHTIWIQGPIQHFLMRPKQLIISKNFGIKLWLISWLLKQTDMLNSKDCSSLLQGLWLNGNQYRKRKCWPSLGLCLAMGIQKLPQMHDYWWKTNWFFETKFNEVMTRDQFDSIWWYLHLQDNNQPNPQDQLWKLRWFLDHLQCKFKELVTPEQNVTVDESMVKYKGCLSFCQYLPSKPTKWGIKVWSLCESSTGYMSNFQVYTGWEGNQEKGLAYRVVHDLTEPYHNTYIRC